jgi:outer membrane receptor protein involved in Fe transport
VQGATSYDLFDLSGTWQFNQTLGVRFGVDNLLDKQPPVIGFDPNAALTGTQFDTNPGYYDVLGRRYYIGFRAQF